MLALDTLRRLNDSAVVRSAVTARYALPDHLPNDDEIVAERGLL